MQKWTAFLLSGALIVAFVVGLFIHPLDSQANANVIWQADFYANSTLDGEPVVSRNDRELIFNWANGAPAAELPTDNFSARWTGKFHFEAGEWLFSAGADDGIRLWVNDVLVIDQWSPSGTFAVYTNTIALSEGRHEVKVEYYDNAGLAGINVDWTPVPAAIYAKVSGDNAPVAPAAPRANPTQVAPGTVLGHVATSTLNVRTGPGIQFERIDQISLYQRFPILGQNEDGSWYLIDLKDGRSGWVASQFIYRTGKEVLPVVETPQPSDPLVVFEGTEGLALAQLNLRSIPSQNGERLALILYNEAVVVRGRSNNSLWYLVDYGEEQGWVFALYINLQGFKVYDLPFVE